MVVFWNAEVEVGESVPFQLSLSASPRISIASLPFISLVVEFSDDISPVVIRHAASESTSQLVQRIDLGHISMTKERRDVETNLRWQAGGTKFFSGTIASETPRLIKVCVYVCL
jgi:hypothetical protein